MSYRFGGSLSANYIHDVFTVQQVFGGETFRVVNVAYFQNLLDDRVELRLGRIAAGDDFLVSPYNYVFVQNGVDGNPVGIFFSSSSVSTSSSITERCCGSRPGRLSSGLCASISSPAS